MGRSPEATAQPPGPRRHHLTLALSLAALLAPVPALAGNPDDLMRLLQGKSCPDCRLQDADLVHADLRDADLSNARLQRANLSRARLDGARLGGADLSFTSLQGASLRGADLRGARLEGTDLRYSDLSGAQLDAGALARTHWKEARGLALRDGPWKLVQRPKAAVELYDLSADVGEATNLAAEHPERVGEMSALLERIRGEGLRPLGLR